jgi:hypothetical protein
LGVASSEPDQVTARDERPKVSYGADGVAVGERADALCEREDDIVDEAVPRRSLAFQLRLELDEPFSLMSSGVGQDDVGVHEGEAGRGHHLSGDVGRRLPVGWVGVEAVKVHTPQQ